MSRPFYRLWYGLVVAVILLAGCQGDGENAAGSGHEHQHVDVPAEYAGLENPLPNDGDQVAAGAAIFALNCAACHGVEGKGDGVAAESLEPRPSDLTAEAMMAEVTDAYLYWRISEGGNMEPFNSAMPAWKGTLSENERWQVILYLRSLVE